MTGQPHAVDANQLIQTAPPSVLAVTDFALHGIPLVLMSVKKVVQFRNILHDLSRRHIWTLHLAPSDLHSVLDLTANLGLDFDDAFQPRGRMTPAQALSEISSAGATP